MAALRKFVDLLKTHKKKAIFFPCVFAGASYYADKVYKENLIRREYCERAAKYGDMPISPHTNPTRVKVILNPQARKRKARKLFEKNAAPLFHLAGLLVDIIETKYEGEAKKIAEQDLGPCDLVVVAGGDGTLLEVVTGLLRARRAAGPPQAQPQHHVPLGVLPLGTTNTLSRRLHSNHTSSDVRWICESAMAIIEGSTTPVDVMKIETEEGLPLYALSHLEWGKYRDARENFSKFWYFGPLKYRLSYVLATWGGWPSTVKGRLDYRLAREGWDRPRPKQAASEAATGSAANGAHLDWWKWLGYGAQGQPPKGTAAAAVESPAELEKPRDDDDWAEAYFEAIELRIRTGNSLIVEQQLKSIDVHVEPMNTPKLEFIQNGWQRMNAKHCFDEDLIRKDDLHVRELKLNASSLQENTSEWFSIDGEAYEMKDIVVELLPNEVKLFSPVYQIGDNKLQGNHS